MLASLGLAGRLVVIVVLFALSLLALAVAASRLATYEEAGARWFPVPEQAAAIAALLDALPPTQRPLAAKALTTERLAVIITDAIPPRANTASRAPVATALVRLYLDEMPDRAIETVRYAPPTGPIRAFLDRMSPLSQTPVDIAMALKGGGAAVLKVRGDTTRRLFGVPAGFWVGIIGFVFAAVTLIAIVREARPLHRLALAVDAFGKDGVPRPVAVNSGAREVRALVTAVDAMQERIASLMRARTIMLGAVSHDLRTFITRLRLRIMQIPSDEQRARAEADIEDMTRLIEDALALARGLDRSAPRAEVDLAALLSAEAADHGERATFTGERATVDGDATALRRLFANLVENAIRYGERADIRLAASAGTVRVDIDDRGPGIAPEDREALLEPFVRGEASRSRETGGAGLGLAIAMEVAKSHGGTLEIGTAPTGGARLTVTLPRAASSRCADTPGPQQDY